VTKCLSRAHFTVTKTIYSTMVFVTHFVTNNQCQITARSDDDEPFLMFGHFSFDPLTTFRCCIKNITFWRQNGTCRAKYLLQMVL